eukprot:jgi/Chrzof1/2232/Cz11g07180.t1_TIC110[v5.2]
MSIIVQQRLGLQRPRAAGCNARPLPRFASVRIGSAWIVKKPAKTTYVAAAAEAVSETAPKFELPVFAEEDYTARPFPMELPMDPNTKMLSSIPLALFYPLILAVAAGAGYLGSIIGKGAPVAPQQKPIATAVIAAVAGAVALYGGMLAKKKRDDAAVIDLYNNLVLMEDPSTLTAEDVKRVGNKYGINLHRDELDGLQKIYGQYLENIIPRGDQQLRGDEAGKIKSFKDALGLSDEEASPVHIEVGRRLSRAGIEYKDRASQFEQRKAFQRLIYLTYIVFGDQKAGFLMPLRRVFNLNDSQVLVARRDNAKEIFDNYLAARGGDLPAERPFLRELRDYQLSIKMYDSSAQEAVRDAARKTVEKHLERAVEAAKAPAKVRDTFVVVDALHHVLDYSRKLANYANDDDLIPGLGMPSIHGGPWDADNRKRDVRDAYKLYVDESVARENRFTAQHEADIKDLATVLCLSNKEATEIRLGVAANLYKKLLREEVTSRRIDAAESPAGVLQDLCERSGFGPEAALEFHKQLYRQKLQQLLTKKKLTDEDSEELKRIRRILCIRKEDADAVAKNTAGRILEEVISDIYLMGAKPISEYESERIDSTIKNLRLETGIAQQVLTDVTKQRFKAYVQQAQKERDRKASAAIIKKLVQFNALVVTPLLDKIKGTEAAKKELADLLVKAAEEAKKEGAEPAPPSAESESQSSSKGASEDPVASMKKIMAANRGEFGEDERKGQKEINLADDLDKPTRAELYKNYLMYSMSGDVVELPVGGVIRKKTNLQARQAEMQRLSQLGDILGMSQAEIGAVHQDLAEQAFRAQATEVMRGSGSLTGERKEYLETMRSQLGLPEATADRIIKEVRTEVLGATAALDDDQKWTIERVLDLHKDGVDVTRMLEEPQRRTLYRKELDKKLSNGKAEFDADLLLKKLPQILGIEEKRVRMLLKELVGSRKRMLLVQAVSQNRQRRPNDAVTSLNNLISAYRASPENAETAGVGVVSWGEREELKDLYSLYCSKVPDDAKRDELAHLFGLNDDEKSEIMAGSGVAADKLKREQEEEAFF